MVCVSECKHAADVVFPYSAVWRHCQLVIAVPAAISCCVILLAQRSVCTVSVDLTHTHITFTVSGREVVSSAGRGRKIVFMGDTCSGEHIAHLAQVGCHRLCAVCIMILPCWAAEETIIRWLKGPPSSPLPGACVPLIFAVSLLQV
jgi:hypothetical protein